MPKVPLNTITSGYGTVDALNQNFDAIEAAFDNTLSRDGDTPNQMQANLDMNGNALLNVGTINGAPITALGDLSGYVNTALAAATSASASATSAADTYDLFDDRYLGSKTSNPTVDNDGNALQVGAEYWNSVSNERRTWTGSAWVSSITVVPDNSVTTAKLADGAVTTAKWASSNGQLAGLRNFIINGDMRISQRGTSFTSIANNAYLLDRWQFINTSSAVLSASQVQSWLTSTDPISTAPEFQNALRLNVTTADTSIAPGDFCGIRQIIEGNNLRSLISKPATLSFWVKSSKNGVHCVAFRNKDTSDRSYIVEYTITNANTWEYKIITIPAAVLNMESLGTGTWDYDNGQGLSITWVLAAGSTFQTTANSWRTGNFLATSNQVNCLDSTSNRFVLTGVQLESGSVATPFEHRPIGAELALCQRYYESWTNNSGGSQNVFLSYGVGSNIAVANTYSFQTAKRAAPTVTISNVLYTNATFSLASSTTTNFTLQLSSTSAAMAQGTVSNGNTWMAAASEL